MSVAGARGSEAGRPGRLAFRLAALTMLLLPAVATGQARVALDGRVRLVGQADTIPLAGATVVAHEIGRARQGPVDSVRSDAAGRFRFRLRADTGSVLLLSARYAGIEYFSDPIPVRTAGPEAVEGVDLVVSDTSAAATVVVATRHIVIGRPEADGVRPVLEIVSLHNPGPATRVGSGPGGGTWTWPLPASIVRFSVGEGAYSPDALTRQGDSLVLAAPIAPGDKQVLYSYGLPAGASEVTFPADDSVGELTLLLEEFDRTVQGGLALVDTARMEDRSFQRWAGPVRAGDLVRVEFTARHGNWGLVLLIGALALVLALGAVASLRRRAPAGQTPGGDLVGEVAQLDARYSGRESEVPPEEWKRYQEDRARLKLALEDELASRRART